jgi:protein ImuA
LVWLPQARAEQLRRLQMAAQAHGKLLFVMRPVQAQSESSPAVLRLLASTQPDSDTLLLHILKRRGPPLDQPLLLPARPARLAALLAIHCGQADFAVPSLAARRARSAGFLQGVDDALGRIASLA